MHQKLVSVIIPTFNRAHLVGAAIRSAKAQTYPAVQIIVVDDGSEDNTAQSVAQFENVEYYRQANGGQASARNLGLKYARGEYVASLDSDDIWNEDFLETAVAAIEKYDVDFVFLNWTAIFEGERSNSDWDKSREWQKYCDGREGIWTVLEAREIRELYIEICPAPSSALVMRRSSLVSGWNERMKIADDWYLILEMVLTKPRRAAFTMSRHWTKHMHTSNIYHGREEYEVIRDLGLHDVALFVQSFDKQLTAREKAKLQKKIAAHYFNFGRLDRKRDGLSFNVFRSIASGFTLSPVGGVLLTLQWSFNSLKTRLRAALNKDKQF